LSPDQKTAFLGEIRDRYDKIRARHARNRAAEGCLSLEQARANALKTDWRQENITSPAKPGLHVFEDYPLEEISHFIDWTFFFHAWRITGRYPAIFDDPIKGTEAKKLYDDAQLLLKQIMEQKMARAKGVIGLFPANSEDDDVILYTDESRVHELSRFRFLRNQTMKEDGAANLCLSDFIAPAGSGIADYSGAFALSAGFGLETWVRQFEEQHDDYSAIMLKILADRLAEAFAELIHMRVRREFWGYAHDESLGLSAMLKEEYRGIRPAPGYPACPEHSEKRVLFDLLGAEENAGIRLTENHAMYPAASVCGFYFAHPLSQYFMVGRIGKDQVEDYARRKGVSVAQAEKWLEENRNY
jgi:5-methyltetrahydrofolate--homocysteine methyltransferase